KLRRNFFSASEARQRKRRGCSPAPARGEHRRVEQRLDQQWPDALRMEVARDLVKREAMAGREREHDRVLGRRSLQLEIEFAAEAFAEREAPCAIDAAAERRMDDQLHAPRLVEEALEHDGLLRRDDAERGARRAEIIDELLRR